MTFEEMKKIVVDTLNCDEDKVTMEASLTEDLEARGCGARTHRAEASHPKLAVLLVRKIKERAEVKEDVLFLKLTRIGSKTGFCNETHGKLIADVLVSTDGEAAGVQHA